MDILSTAKCEISFHQALVLLHEKKLVIKSSSSEMFEDSPARIITDSRSIGENDCFLALRGQATDGHIFVPEAVARNVRFLILESDESIPTECKTPFILVKNSRAAWSHLAARAFKNPELDLEIIAVTGTNGKTSTVWMIGEILRRAGVNCLTIGTLGADFGNEVLPTQHTTPDPDILFMLLNEARSRGYQFVAMEASSHAIVQQKLSPIRFCAAAFTSFSRDHLDFHNTLEEYLHAKLSLFSDYCKPNARKIFSSELLSQANLLRNTDDLWFYGQDSSKSGRNFLEIVDVKESRTKTALTFRLGKSSKTIEIPYFGRHCIENFCAAYLLVDSLQLNNSENNFLSLRQVPGRLQQISNDPRDPQVIVDYAHTPDALQKTLEVLRPLCFGNLIVIFGCGGDRDRGKRPIMGKVAENHADVVCITSDNPRTEDPSAIMNDILAGLSQSKKASLIQDRKSAINRMIQKAAINDTILIAGKGHENYQIIGNTKFPFDDCLVASEALLLRHKINETIGSC